MRRFNGGLIVTVMVLTGLTGCGVASTEPRAITETVAPTRPTKTTAYVLPGGRLELSVPIDVSREPVFFIRNGRLDQRLRSVSLPRIEGIPRLPAETRDRILKDRKDAALRALLAGPEGRERDEGTTSSLGALLDLSAPDPIVVSAIIPGTVIVDIRQTKAQASDQAKLEAFAQIVWTLEPDSARTVRFQTTESGTVVELEPRRENPNGLPDTVIGADGSDYQCLRFDDCVDAPGDTAAVDSTAGDSTAGDSTAGDSTASDDAVSTVVTVLPGATSPVTTRP
jgi:hypothetical protein